jgi:hypothetical protein
VKDAIAFVEDSKTNRADVLWKRTMVAASEESGIQLNETLRPMYLKVFNAAVETLVDWDFETGFDHNP